MSDGVTARRLDGRALARTIHEELAPKVDAFAAAAGRSPGLGIVLVGDDPASRVYVRTKRRAGERLGVWVDVHELSASATLAEMLDIVTGLNRSSRHDGILVQAPLPASLGAEAGRVIVDAIEPAKDVDGFHPINVGRLVQGRPTLLPCTPAGILELLDHAEIAIEGRHAVVLGRSEIVGKPVALLLLRRHATVTICHSRTRDLGRVAATADVLVAAIGRPAFVTPDLVKPGATVIDVGINRVGDRDTLEQWYGSDSPRWADFARQGSLLVGDVHPAVEAVAGALTPVPGGVGPLTVAMLMRNTLAAAEARRAGSTP